MENKNFFTDKIMIFEKCFFSYKPYNVSIFLLKSLSDGIVFNIFCFIIAAWTYISQFSI